MSRQHKVQSGECFATLARRYGYDDYTALYDHPENADLKRRRPNPNVLYPGDVVSIPELAQRTESLAVDRQHRFRVHRPKKELRLVVRDAAGEALASAEFAIRIDAYAEIEGVTDGDGLLRVPVPVGARSATLRIGERSVRLSLNALVPIADAPDDGVRGAQARLRNLGYWVGSRDGQLDASTRGAIAMFQRDCGLAIDGELTPQLADRLIEEHGS